MKTSITEAFFWAASFGVYVAAAWIVVFRKGGIRLRPATLPLVLTIALFAVQRGLAVSYPQYELAASIGFTIAAIWTVLSVFGRLRPQLRNEGLFALLYCEALAPMLLIALGDFFSPETTYAMQNMATWMCAAPAITVLVFFTWALLMKTAP